nr:immunoglobulin heavy chain junction region [Macaca mulatta]
CAGQGYSYGYPFDYW